MADHGVDEVVDGQDELASLFLITNALMKITQGVQGVILNSRHV